MHLHFMCNFILLTISLLYRMKKRNLVLHMLSPVIVLMVLFNSSGHTTVLEFIFKPLIMVWIASYFVVNLTAKNHPIVKPALFAFFFSWIGDIVLMFSGSLFFLSGLSAFLIAQFFYICLFQKTDDRTSTPLLKKNPSLILPYVVCGSVLLWILLPRISAVEKPAIFLYTLIIMTMAVSALNRKGRVSTGSFLLVLVGSILFVASDSLIAIHKSGIKIPHSGFWVMSTYISAQYLIMIGLLAQVNNKNTKE